MNAFFTTAEFIRGSHPTLEEKRNAIVDLLGTHLTILGEHLQVPEFHVLSGRVEASTCEAGAFDLFSTGHFEIGVTPVAISTGVFTKFDSNLVAIIKERSGLALFQNFDVKGGVIDADFDGSKLLPDGNYDPKFEWKVISRSIEKPFSVKPGDKIAQFIVVKKPKLMTSGIVFRKDVRQGGFGSTNS